MKDKNGIDVCCENCDVNAQRDCANWNSKSGKEGTEYCVNDYFLPSYKAYEARIAELQRELTVVQESERAEAQEADRLRGEVKELKAHNDILQKRVEEFSMELLDRLMKENKDVLERLKQAENEDNYKNYEIESDDE